MFCWMKTQCSRKASFTRTSTPNKIIQGIRNSVTISLGRDQILPQILQKNKKISSGWAPNAHSRIVACFFLPFLMERGHPAFTTPLFWEIIIPHSTRCRNSTKWELCLPIFLYPPSYNSTAFTWKNKNHLFENSKLGILKSPQNKKILQTEKNIICQCLHPFCRFQNNVTIFKPRKKNISLPEIRIGTHAFALCRDPWSMECLKCLKEYGRANFI